LEDEEKGVQVRGWDKGLDYEKTYRKLVRMLRATREGAKRSHRKKRRLACISVLLIQLRNGCRVGEGIEALRKFCETEEREVRVRIEKKKEPKYRLIVLPKEITKEDLRLISDVVWEINRHNVKNFAYYHFKANTHSMRYAFVTYYAKRGINPQLIAKIIGHSDLSHLLSYTQRVEAEDILRRGA